MSGTSMSAQTKTGRNRPSSRRAHPFQGYASWVQNDVNQFGLYLQFPTVNCLLQYARTEFFAVWYCLSFIFPPKFLLWYILQFCSHAAQFFVLYAILFVSVLLEASSQFCFTYLLIEGRPFSLEPVPRYQSLPRQLTSFAKI